MVARKKVVVAMSGGVDSSVAAALLKRAGYDCVGVFMRLGGQEESTGAVACSPEKQRTALALHPSQVKNSHKQGCCSASDATDARYVAGLLDIPFYALNFQHDFGGIIDYFVREYNSGRTPNPCVRCNEYLKFGKLSRYARAIGADYVATGHYARIIHMPAKNPRATEPETQLLRARDHAKDQSYVLFGVPKTELSRMLLPLGDLEKIEVRRLAEELKLPVFDKPDSQEICFVPDQDYAGLIKKRSPDSLRPGHFVNADGKFFGTHAGHQHFTLGQRRGLGVDIGHTTYVTAIDPGANRVTLGPKEDLLHRTLVAREVNWLAGENPRGPLRVYAKVRYKSVPAAATAVFTGPDELTLCFDKPIVAITPGQAVVCYDEPQANGDQRLLGGGWIDRVMS